MITIYVRRDGALVVQPMAAGEPMPAGTLWIDLFEPTRDEEIHLETMLRIDIPTREEMEEIEASSRLYRNDDVLFMTASVVVNASGSRPSNAAVTFILVGTRLMTVRYATPSPFRTFPARLAREYELWASADRVLLGLLGALVDRAADILEIVDDDVDAVGQGIHGQGQGAPMDNGFREALQRIGRQGNLASKATESLVSLDRLTAFLAGSVVGRLSADERGMADMLRADVRSLVDHAGFVQTKLSFLLDATLGMINIQQNNIIKIFSVVAFVFLPPTLIASIYGMNFKFMPELEWAWGYPLAIVLMVISATLPYLFFKRRGWL